MRAWPLAVVVLVGGCLYSVPVRVAEDVACRASVGGDLVSLSEGLVANRLVLEAASEEAPADPLRSSLLLRLTWLEAFLNMEFDRPMLGLLERGLDVAEQRIGAWCPEALGAATETRNASLGTAAERSRLAASRCLGLEAGPGGTPTLGWWSREVVRGTTATKTASLTAWALLDTLPALCVVRGGAGVRGRWNHEVYPRLGFAIGILSVVAELERQAPALFEERPFCAGERGTAALLLEFLYATARNQQGDVALSLPPPAPRPDPPIRRAWARYLRIRLFGGHVFTPREAAELATAARAELPSAPSLLDAVMTRLAIRFADEIAARNTAAIPPCR